MFCFFEIHQLSTATTLICNCKYVLKKSSSKLTPLAAFKMNYFNVAGYLIATVQPY